MRKQNRLHLATAVKPKWCFFIVLGPYKGALIAQKGQNFNRLGVKYVKFERALCHPPFFHFSVVQQTQLFMFSNKENFAKLIQIYQRHFLQLNIFSMFPFHFYRRIDLVFFSTCIAAMLIL